MSTRKLPPLPGSRPPFGNKSNAVLSTPSSNVYPNEKRVIHKSNKDVSKTLSDGPFRPALVSTAKPSESTSDKEAPQQCKSSLKPKQFSYSGC